MDPPAKIGRVLSVEDWAEIRRLHRGEGMAIKAIARRLGVGRITVRRALASVGPPRYERSAGSSIVDSVEPQIRALLADCPSMPATVIAERVGWARSLTVLKTRVRELRRLAIRYLAMALAPVTRPTSESRP